MIVLKGLLWVLLGLLGFLAAVLVLLLLLCLVRVGALASYDGEVLALDLKFGWFRIHLLPVKPSVSKRRKKPKRTRAKEEKPKEGESTGESEEKKSKGFPFTAPDILDVVQTLFPALKRFVVRFGRGLHIKPLRVSVALAGLPDPASAAQQYGYAQVVLWTCMPAVERFLRISDPQIHLEVDFESSALRVEFQIGAAFRIGTAVLMGLSLLIPAIRWFLRTRRRKKLSTVSETEKDVVPDQKDAA